MSLRTRKTTRATSAAPQARARSVTPSHHAFDVSLSARPALAGRLLVMPISDYIHNLRTKIGNDLLLLPSVGAVILNDERHVLLQRSTDDGKWYVPGGAIDPGEEPADAI